MTDQISDDDWLFCKRSPRGLDYRSFYRVVDGEVQVRAGCSGAWCRSAIFDTEAQLRLVARRYGWEAAKK